MISEMSSGRRQASSIVTPWRIARYSGRARPAWRMNHTGRMAAGRRRIVARKMLWPDLESSPEPLPAASPGVALGITMVSLPCGVPDRSRSAQVATWQQDDTVVADGPQNARW